MNQAEMHQKGGVVSFIVVGVVLLALLVGGVYLSKQHGRTASRSGTPAPQKVVETDTKQDNTPQKQPATENKKQDDTSSTSKSNDNAAKQPAKNDSSSQPKQSTPPAVANTGPSHIASTGPEHIITAMVALAALTAGIGIYRQSAARMHRAALDSSL